jgi:DNA-binding NtrC family response regulator
LNAAAAPVIPLPRSEPATVPAENQVVSLAEVERQHILAAIQRTGNNRTQAAQLLGISIRTLRNKLNEYNSQAGGNPTESEA